MSMGIGSLDRPIADLAASQHGVLTRAQLLSLGATNSRVTRLHQTGRLERVENGVYRLAGGETTDRQTVMIAVLASRQPAYASHLTAAYLWGFSRMPNVQHVLAVGGRWRPKAFFVHRTGDLGPDHAAVLDGIPVTTPARTLVDLPAVVRRYSYERLYDEAIRLRLTTPAEVLAIIDEVARQGRTGVLTARAVSESRYGWSSGDSPLEDEFIRLLAGTAIRLPEPQFVVTSGGTFVARVDFAYPEERIAIEVDGYSYHSDPVAFARDRERQNSLQNLGYRILRFTAHAIRTTPSRVIDDVNQALRSSL